MAYASVGVALAVALAALGLSGHSIPALGMQLRSGQVWLSNLANGSISFIDGYSGEVVGQVAVADATSQVVNSTDGAVVVGSDGRLIQVSNANFTTSPSVELLGGGSLTAAAGGSALYAINLASGQVQQLNPAESNLPPIGPAVSVGSRIVTPVVAPDGSLYVGVPKTGAVGRVRDGLLTSIPGVAAPGHQMAVVLAGSQPVGADLTAGVVRPLGVAAVAGPGVRLPASGLPIRELTGSDSVNGLVGAVTTDAVESADVTTGAVSSTSLPTGFTPTGAVMQGRNVVLIDSARQNVLFVDTARHATRMLAMPGDQPPSQLTVQDGLVFVNASDGPNAMVISGAGQVRPITKYTSAPPSRPKPAKLPSATPSASSSVSTQTHRAGQPNTAGPPKVPSAPTDLTAQPSSGSVTVSWGPPANGSQVARYLLAWSGGGATGSETVAGKLDATVGGLANGTPYTFTIKAQNAAGTGPPATTQPVTPSATVPAQPAGVTATAATEGGSVALTWTEPAGGPPVQSYTITNEVSGATQSANGTTATFPNVVTAATTFPATFTFTVTAVDAQGVAGPPSSASNAVSPFLAPGAPALTGDITYSPAGTSATLTVSCDAACQGNNPVQSYTVAPGQGVPAVTQPVASGDTQATITLSGLAPGQTYNAEVTATDAAGVSTPASPDNATVTIVTLGPPIVTSVTVNPGAGGLGASAQVVVAVSVNPDGEASSCQIQVSLSNNGGTANGACGTSTQTFTITVPTFATTYTATVTASDTAGSSASPGTGAGASNPESLTANASTAFGNCPNYYGSSQCGSSSSVFASTSVKSGQVATVSGGSTVLATCWETGSGVSGANNPSTGYGNGTEYYNWVAVTSPADGYMSELYFPDPKTVTDGLPPC
jgi:hypothetical protein